MLERREGYVAPVLELMEDHEVIEEAHHQPQPA
jgi:hypothetical protein